MPKGQCKHIVNEGWCSLMEDTCPHFDKEDYQDCESYEEQES